MRAEMMEILCCPIDKHDLELKAFVKDTKGDIIEGIMTCAKCKRHYPIIHGIPIMSPDEYREPALEAPVVDKWQAALPEEKGR